MIKTKYIGIAVVALFAVVGSSISVLTLSAQDPPTATPQPLSSAIATANAEQDAEVTYCDHRSDGISVQGNGVVTIPASIGVIDLGVEVTAETISVARSEAAEAMTNVINAVQDEGVEDDDITTTQLNIWPEITWVEEWIDLGDDTTGRRSREVVTEYRVTNRARIEIDLTAMAEEMQNNGGSTSNDSGSGSEESDVLGSVIDAAAGAGGDHVRIHSISFRAVQTPETVDKARKLAAADALHRATLYANAFGVEVGTLLSANETFASTPVYRDVVVEWEVAAAAAEPAPSPSTPISVGDVEVWANISAKFAIVQLGCVDKAAAAKSKPAE